MKRRSILILSLLSKKTDPKNNEYTFDFRWTNGQQEDEEDIVKENFIDSLQKKTDEEELKK